MSCLSDAPTSPDSHTATQVSLSQISFEKFNKFLQRNFAIFVSVNVSSEFPNVSSPANKKRKLLVMEILKAKVMDIYYL